MQRLQPLVLAIAMLLLSACSDSGTQPPPAPVPDTVTISPQSAVLPAIGDTVRLVAQVRSTDGTLMPDVAVTWSVQETGIATVDAQGLVTALAPGLATVRAQVTGTPVDGSASVSVEQVASAVTVSSMPDSLVVGQTAALSASAADANGYEVAGAKFTWSTSDSAVATVDGNGLVTAVGAGPVEITARSGSAHGTQGVTVFRPNVVATAGTVLAGDVHVRTFTVPEGVTITAPGDVAIRADDGITIAGAVVSDCGAVTIVAGGDITVGGTLSNACADSTAEGGPLTVIGTGDVVMAGGLTSSGDVYITNDSTLTDADFPPRPVLDDDDDDSAGAAATLAAGSTRELRRLGAALAGRPRVDGACRLIGEFRAREKAPAPHQNGAGFRVRCRNIVLQTVTMVAGGGATAPKVRTVHAIEALAEAGDGSPGGWVEIQATGTITTLGRVRLFAGRGGRGGEAEAIGQLDSGTPEQAAGARAVSGNGGAGGIVRMTAGGTVPDLSGFHIVHGQGGSGGTARAWGAHGRDGTPQIGGRATATGGRGGPGINPGVGGYALAYPGNGASGDASHRDGTRGGTGRAVGGRGGRAWDVPGIEQGPGGYGGEANTERGDGGAGYGSCEPPGVAGNGGPGGSLGGRGGDRGPGAGTSERSPVTVWSGGNGGRGGDGSPAGSGGAAGSNDMEAPSRIITRAFERGADGSPCPEPKEVEIGLSNMEFGGTHHVGISPCPTPLGTFELTNTGNVAVTWSAADVVGAALSPATGELQPGQSVTVTVQFDCDAPFSINTRLAVTAVEAGGTASMTVPVHVAVTTIGMAVTLDNTHGSFAKGSVISLLRITGDAYIGEHQSGCDNLAHLHSNSAIHIDGEGPFSDPNGEGCGYGLVANQTLPLLPDGWGAIQAELAGAGDAGGALRRSWPPQIQRGRHDDHR